MTTEKILYGAPVTVAITIHNKATGVIQSGVFIDNTLVKCKSGHLFLKYKTGATGIVATSAIKIYVYGSPNDANYSNFGVDGTDQIATSFFKPQDVRKILLANVASQQYIYKPLDTWELWDGPLPERHGYAIENSTGGNSDATNTNFSLVFKPVFLDGV
jgi:hypothetical protein